MIPTSRIPPRYGQPGPAMLASLGTTRVGLGRPRTFSAPCQPMRVWDGVSMEAARSLTFVLHPVPPFRLDLTAWTLRRRARNPIDRWDGHPYARTIVVGERAVDLEVTAEGSRLRVFARGATSPAVRTAATELLRRALGLQIDLAAFYRLARGDARLAHLVDRF